MTSTNLEEDDALDQQPAPPSQAPLPRLWRDAVRRTMMPLGSDGCRPSGSISPPLGAVAASSGAGRKRPSELIEEWTVRGMELKHSWVVIVPEDGVLIFRHGSTSERARIEMNNLTLLRMNMPPWLMRLTMFVAKQQSKLPRKPA